MTLVVVLIPSGSNWTVPTDYGTPSTVDCFGCGAQGGQGIISPPSQGPGGGGAAWARVNNLPLTPGSLVPIFIGGVSGGSRQTWFQSTSTVLADGGNGQSGGLAVNSVGDTTFDGGNGGNGVGPIGGGGGGAAGPNGAGGTVTGNTGGQGGNGFGGAGGSPAIGGSDGMEYNITAGGTAGSGGGGGGAVNFGGSIVVGAGGQYGAGGGGAYNGTPFPTGAPGVGVIIVTYTSSSGPPPGGAHRRVGGCVVG